MVSASLAHGPHKGRKSGIHADIVDDAIEFLDTHIQQRHLLTHALTRTQSPFTSLRFKDSPPWSRKSFEHNVGHILNGGHQRKVAQVGTTGSPGNEPSGHRTQSSRINIARLYAGGQVRELRLTLTPEK